MPSRRNRRYRRLLRRQQEQENQANEVPEEEHNNQSIHSVIDLLDKFKEQMTDNEYIEACNTLMRLHRETARRNEDEEDLLRNWIEKCRDLQLRCLSMETERIEFYKVVEGLEEENYQLEEQLYEKDKLIEEMRKKLTQSIHEPKNPNEDNPLYYTCECGSYIQKTYKKKHETSKKHLTYKQR